MPSTTGRGVGCSSPSSGRTRRRNGAQGRSRSHATAGQSSTTPPTRSRRVQAGLQRDPAAHAVPGEVGAIQLQRVQQVDHPAAEPWRVVGRADRLVGLAEAGQVDRNDAVALRRQGRQRGEERGLRPPRPWSATTGSPIPASTTDSRPVFVRTE